MFSATLAGMSPRPALDPALLSHLISAQRLEDRRGRRSSGLPALDRLLGGGWPRAALCELVGRRSSGRTAILYAALARAISAGEAVALVDVGGGLDPRRAFAAGIVLRRLLWIRCAADAAAKAADLVLGAGGFDLIALDLGDARPRLPTAGWIRFKHGAEKQGTTVLVSAPARAAGACAAAVVELGPGTPRFVADGAPLFAGLRASAVRARGGPEPEQLESEEARCASLAFSCRS
jgi:protein ImuA